MLIKSFVSLFRQSVRQTQLIKLVSSNNIHKITKINLTHKTSYLFTTSQNQNSSYFVFTSQNQPQLLKLELQYRSQQKVSIFQNSIKSCTNVMDQLNIYKIFKIMQTSPFNLQSYEKFFEFIDKNIKKKSDNMKLLMATIKQKIAKHYIQQKNYQLSVKYLQESLDILQTSLVPPLFPYYSIYREYGFVYSQIGQKQKTKQILTQTVDILDDFVSHSDDNVSSNDFCRKQAKAYNILANIDPQNKSKWLNKANDIWQKFAQNRFAEIQYIKTICLNYKKYMKEDKQKGQSYYHFNMFKIQNKDFKQLLKKAKSEVQSNQ